MTTQKPLVLITNDDGIEAPGLLALTDCIRAISDEIEICVVAPKVQHSGQSSAITVGAPLFIEDRGDYNGAAMLTVSGTPVDCVKLALDAIVPRTPDMVVSGVNHGSNSGNAITYSGTMGAVLEACTVGIPAVGFSLTHHSIRADFSLSAPMVTDIAARVLHNGLPDYTALNINIPARITPLGVKVCRAARGHWSEEYAQYIAPSGRPFYWLTGHFVNEEADAMDTDEYWLSQGYISAVPVTPEQTAFYALDKVKELLN
ncbi:MAG: 5'/3'-nucleotidase SurE [Muribaculaceae bacterium]|nr:5'/3'-nucleotidase SurE [Muribaculaceae bacterium]